MKPYVLIWFCFLLFPLLKAEEAPKKHEFGTTVMTLNLYRKSPFVLLEYRPRREFLKGIFYRYSKNRAAVKATVSYASNFSSYGGPFDVYQDPAGTLFTKDLRAGCGGQYTLVKKFVQTYLFADIAYRHVHSEGRSSGGTPGYLREYKARSHGVDAHTGLGLGFRIFRIVNVSPECSFNFAYGAGIRRTTIPQTNRVYESGQRDGNANPVFRLHVSVLI